MPRSSSKSPVGSGIILDAIDACSKKVGRSITYKDIAESTGICSSSVWFSVNSDRSWQVDRWLKALQTLGCLSYQGNQIVISMDKLTKYKKFFSEADNI